MLNKFSVRVKLYLLLFITGGSLIILGLYGIEDLKKMDENTHSLYADRVLPIRQLSTIKYEYVADILPLAQKVKEHQLTFKEAAETLQKTQKIINTNWQNYKLTYLTPQEALLVKQTDLVKNRVDGSLETLTSILSKEDPAALDMFIQNQAVAEQDPFFIKLTQLMALQVQVGKEILNSNHAIYRITAQKFIFLMFLSLGIALSLSLYIVKNIKGLVKNISINNNIIKESEERYRSLFEQASDAIFVVDFKGNFTQVNDSMCKTVGYTHEELLTMNVAELLNDDLLKLNPLLYDKVAPGTSIIGERKFIHKNGTIVHIEVNAKKFADGRVLVIFRDITRRKEMEAELRNAETKFRTLTDKSMVGIYIVQKGKFVYVNPRFAQVFGYEPHELTGSNPVEKIIHPHYQATSAENIRARVEDGKDSVHYEAMGKRKDGTANWVEFFGSSAVFEDEPTIIGSMIDITGRKQAEDELRSSEQKYKLLFESNPVPLWMVSRDDLSIIAVNEPAATLYGYTKDELLNTSVTIVRHPDDFELQEQRFKTDIDGPTDRGINKHIKKDGTILFVNVIVNDIMFEGRMVRLILTSDVTEKLKAEEELRKTDANLQTILNTTDTAYALVDRNLTVLEFNAKALNFARNEFNFDPEKSGKIFDNLPETRRQQFFSYIDKVFKGDTISYEVNYDHPGGSDAWYSVRMFPLADKENEILGMVLAITDITERKEAEQSLQAAYERIKNHITFIRELIWKQSHILRSPLANLKGLMAIIRADPNDRETLKHLETELQRMDAVFMEMAKDSSADDMNY